MKKRSFNINLKGPAVLLLFMVLIQILNAQDIDGSFGNVSSFYEKCAHFEGEWVKEVSEIAWKGERISRPILIWTESDVLEYLDYDVSDFTSSKSTISSGNARLRSLKFARADIESRPCEAYKERDSAAFVELGDILTVSLESTLNKDCPAILWLTIDIPHTSESGIYKGNITFSVSEEVKITFTLNIHVVDYILPEISEWDFHLDLWQFPTSVADRYNDSHPSEKIEYWSEAHFNILKRSYKLLADMGQKVITAHIKEGALGSPSMVKWIRNANGGWRYDYTIFDKYVDSLISWGISEQISCQSPVGWNSELLPYWSSSEKNWKALAAPIETDIYAERLDHFLTDFRSHLDAKGWFNRSVLYLDEVEPEILSRIIGIIKDNHPDWKIGMAGFHSPSDFVDSSVYDMSLMVGTEVNPGRRNMKTRSSFYTSCNPIRPNNFVVGDAQLAENRWIGWHAQQMNYNGFLRWAFDYWVNNDPNDQRNGSFTSGDFSLAYRSSNNLDMEICSSLRLELIREGIEDYEKISILKAHLRHSDKPYEQAAYKLLLEKIAAFTASSGNSEDVSQLVESAVQLLNKISTGADLCKIVI